MSPVLPPVSVLLLDRSGRVPTERWADWAEALAAYPGSAVEHRARLEPGLSLGAIISGLGLRDDDLLLVADADATPGPHLVRRMVEELAAEGVSMSDARVLPVEVTRVGSEPRGYYVSDEPPDESSEPIADGLLEKRHHVADAADETDEQANDEDANVIEANVGASDEEAVAHGLATGHDRTAQDGAALKPRVTGACCLMPVRVARDLAEILESGPTGETGPALTSAAARLGLDLVVADTAAICLPVKVDWDANIDGVVDPPPSTEPAWSAETHPGRLPGTSLGSLLASVNIVPDPVSQGVDARAPFLTIVTRTQGARLHCLEDMLTCLAAQSDRDFEVLVMCHRTTRAQWASVEGILESVPAWLRQRVRMVAVERPGRAAPLNDGFEAARGRYIVALDDDDTVLAHYVATFKAAAVANEGMLLRAVAIRQDVAPVGSLESLCPVSINDPFREWPMDYHLVDHLLNNYSPFMSVAFSRGAFHDLGLRFDEALDTTEDWDFMVRAACLVGVASIREVTCVYRWWVHTASSREAHSKKEWDEAKKRIQQKFSSSALLLPKEAIDRFRVLMQRSGWEAKKANDLAREYATSQHEVILTLQKVKKAHDDAVRARDKWMERTKKNKAKVADVRARLTKRHTEHLQLLREAGELLDRHPRHRPAGSIFDLALEDLRALVDQLRESPVKKSLGGKKSLGARLRSRG